MVDMIPGKLKRQAAVLPVMCKLAPHIGESDQIINKVMS